MTRSRSERQRRYQANQKLKNRQKQRAGRRAGLRIALIVAGLAAFVALLVVLWNFLDDDAAGPSPDSSPAAALPTKVAPQYPNAPPATDALATQWQATIQTNRGAIELELDGAKSPAAVSSFMFLANEGFFDGTACHRLIPASLLQCGDPTATGTGGPGYSFGPVEDYPESGLYEAGTIAMARIANDGNSMGSQFFLVFDDVQLPADSAGGYTVMGKITNGLEILREVGAAGNLSGSAERPALDVIIQHVEIK